VTRKRSISSSVHCTNRYANGHKCRPGNRTLRPALRGICDSPSASVQVPATRNVASVVVPCPGAELSTSSTSAGFASSNVTSPEKRVRDGPALLSKAAQSHSPLDEPAPKEPRWNDLAQLLLFHFNSLGPPFSEATRSSRPAPFRSRTPCSDSFGKWIRLYNHLFTHGKNSAYS
jgi:hypothetical protein